MRLADKTISRQTQVYFRFIEWQLRFACAMRQRCEIDRVCARYRARILRTNEKKKNAEEGVWAGKGARLKKQGCSRHSSDL